MKLLFTKGGIPAPTREPLPQLFAEPKYLQTVNRRYLVRVQRTQVVEVPVIATSPAEAEMIAKDSMHGQILSHTDEVLATKEGL